MDDSQALKEPLSVGLGMRINVLFLAVAGLLLAGIYWWTFIELVRIWDIDPNYSHGFAVPLFSLIIAAFAWRQHGGPIRGQVPRSAIWLGSLEIVCGLVLHFAAWLLANLLFDVVSLVLVLRGLLLVLGGQQARGTFGFAALFLIFMAPLPIAWYQPVAVVMQQIVSGISTQFLEACGVAVYREGYLIHLPGYTMEVGEACSGLRQLTAVLALAVGIGYFSGRPTWYRWTLALLSVPIAIAANCVRVMLTGAILMLFGKKWAEGVFHTLEGLALVGVAAALVVGAAWGLAKIEDWFKREAGASETT